jgi:rhodanese-related sulfurtransferase
VILINQQGAVVVDLRDKAEYTKGHIIDSVNVPFAKLDKELEDLGDKEKPIVLVCKLGQNATAAGKKLGAKGYTQVHRLKGGISEWQAMQMPLVK